MIIYVGHPNNTGDTMEKLSTHVKRQLREEAKLLEATACLPVPLGARRVDIDRRAELLDLASEIRFRIGDVRRGWRDELRSFGLAEGPIGRALRR
jgi:lipid A disaccharide synthetase